MSADIKSNTKESLDLAIKRKESELRDLNCPKDKYYFIYIMFFLLGLSNMLQWTFFTTSLEYWMHKFRNTTSNETSAEFRTDLQASFSASCRTTLQVSEVIFLSSAILFSRFFRVRPRLITVLTATVTFFSVITVFTKINTDSWQEEFFGMVMAIVSATDAVNAVVTITSYTIISRFPQSYLAVFLTGGGVSRFWTAGFQVLFLTFDLPTVDSALLYFGLGTALILVTLLLFISSRWNEFYLYHMKEFEEGQREKKIKLTEGFQVIKKIWSSILMLGIFLITVDAAPTALVVSEGEGEGVWNDVYFIPVISFLLPGICDLIGRGISFKFAPKISGTGWVIVSALRSLIFIPLFIFCNAQPRHHLKVLFPHDYQYIIFTIIHNVMGGYLFTRCTYNITTLVTKEELHQAYHLNMLFGAAQMAVYSFINLLVVNSL